MDKEDVLMADIQVALNHKPDESVVEEHLFEGLLSFDAPLLRAFPVAPFEAVVEADEQDKTAQDNHKDTKAGKQIFRHTANFYIFSVIDQFR